MLKLSKTQISTFCGDIVSLRVDADCRIDYCKSEDEAVARIKELGTGKYLVILDGVGTTQIAVSAGGNTSLCRVSVREALKSDPDGKLKTYVCDTHAHTSYSDGLATPYDVYNQVSEEEHFDFFAVTDHTELLDDDEFFHTFEAADMYTDDNFTAFAGSESQIMNYYTTDTGETYYNGGEIVLLNKEGYADTTDWNKFFELTGSNKYGVAIIAHPFIKSYRHSGALHNAFDPYHFTTQKTLELIHGVETLNETNCSNMVNERAYSVFLDCGYKVSPYGASDHHGPRWGKNGQACRTFIYSQNKGKEYFLDAMRNARTYSCENGNVKLFYTVNGKNLATTLPATDTYVFNIHTEPFFLKRDEDETVFVEVISDYGQVVASRNVGKLEFDFDITVKSDTARYFYLKLYSRKGECTWSCPVWTGRNFDKLPEKSFDKPALNDKDFKAKSWSGGKNAGGILSADTGDYVQLSDPNGEIVVDMGKMRTLSAIGYHPHKVERGNRETYASLMSEYVYLVSDDCINFKKVASGRVRLFGQEHIHEFEPCECRYVKIRVLSTVGTETRNEKYTNIGAAIGALRFY